MLKKLRKCINPIARIMSLIAIGLSVCCVAFDLWDRAVVNLLIAVLLRLEANES